MHGAPWGTMTGWLQLEVEERAQRYGRPTRRARQSVSATPVVHTPAPQPVPALAKDDVTACA